MTRNDGKAKAWSKRDETDDGNTLGQQTTLETLPCLPIFSRSSPSCPWSFPSSAPLVHLHLVTSARCPSPGAECKQRR